MRLSQYVCEQAPGRNPNIALYGYAKEIAMSHALKEKPYAEELPATGAAAMILDGRYLPPPEDKDGKLWVRTSALIHADAEELYRMWRDVEAAPLWQEQIER